MKKLLLAMALVGFACSSQAAGITGNDLYEGALAAQRLNDNKTIDANEAMHAGVFVGYTVASSNYLQVIKAACFPLGTINTQKFDVVTNYLKSHPEKRADDAGLIVYNALHDAYPCTK